MRQICQIVTHVAKLDQRNEELTRATARCLVQQVIYTADAVPTVTFLLPVERYARVTADEERVLSLHSLNRDQIV